MDDGTDLKCTFLGTALIGQSVCLPLIHFANNYPQISQYLFPIYTQAYANVM